jgi:hypothetical protein
MLLGNAAIYDLQQMQNILVLIYTPSISFYMSPMVQKKRSENICRCSWRKRLRAGFAQGRNRMQHIVYVRGRRN